MKIVFKYRHIILLWILFSVQLSAQNDLQNQFDYANNLFSAGQYFDAITEYKRLLFFDSSYNYFFIANMKIGESYKAGAKLDDAVRYFSIAEMNSRSNEQKYSAQIEIIKTNILRKTTDRALQLLDEMNRNPLYADKTDSLNYWRGWAYMFADDWQNASQTFNKIPFGHELKSICDQVINDKVSVTFAKVISYILPGSGQIYTGHLLSGLLSLGYNSLFGYLTVNSFIEDRVFDGAAIGTLLWLRFYRGNLQNAESFAIEKNIEVANKALDYLQNHYQGSKP